MENEAICEIYPDKSGGWGWRGIIVKDFKDDKQCRGTESYIDADAAEKNAKFWLGKKWKFEVIKK